MAEEKKVNAAPAKAAVAVKKDDTKPGFFTRVGKWFREMKSELKKVIWPTSVPVNPASSVRPNQGSRQMKGPLGLAHTARSGNCSQNTVT